MLVEVLLLLDVDVALDVLVLLAVDVLVVEDVAVLAVVLVVLEVELELDEDVLEEVVVLVDGASSGRLPLHLGLLSPWATPSVSVSKETSARDFDFVLRSTQNPVLARMVQYLQSGCLAHSWAHCHHCHCLPCGDSLQCSRGLITRPPW